MTTEHAKTLFAGRFFAAMNNSSLSIMQTSPQQSDSRATSGQDAKLRQACDDFEALMLSQLLKTMRSSVPNGGLLPKSSGEQLYQEMLDGEYAKEISRSGAVGVGAELYRQFQLAAPMKR